MAKFRKTLEPDFKLEKSSNSIVEMSRFTNFEGKISDGFSITDEDETSGTFKLFHFQMNILKTSSATLKIL